MHYELIEDNYVLFNGEEILYNAGPKVAIAFSYHPNDVIPGTLHKHGRLEAVEEWAEKFRNKVAPVAPEIANELVVVSGHIDIEELNKSISINGYVGKWYKEVLDMIDNWSEIETAVENAVQSMEEDADETIIR
jgi:hypothetical protein